MAKTKGKKKKQVVCMIEEDLYVELKKISEETQLPMARVIEFRLRGYKFVKDDNL